MSDAKVSNEYTRDFYDEFLQKHQDEYENRRWHASPEREFDYNETRKALGRALEAINVDSTVEVGPGDGVWTRIIKKHTKTLHLIEQSEEMITRAQSRLAGVEGITYEHSDLITARNGKYDLVISIRCFEYLEDKEAAMKKLADLTSSSGRLVIITKNAAFLGTREVQKKRLHTGQVTHREMRKLLEDHGFTLKYVYPAVFRIKARFAPLRILSKLLHGLMVFTKNFTVVPFSSYATESFVYVAERNH